MKSYKIIVDSQPGARSVIVWRSDSGFVFAKREFTGDAAKALLDFVNYIGRLYKIEPGDSITIENLEDSIKVDSQPGVRKMRITEDEIESAIEMFVNSVYDDENSGWINAKFEDWVNAVYEELVTWKMGESGCTFYVSNENRFDGKETIVERIKPLLKKRLTELKEEGYDIKAI